MMFIGAFLASKVTVGIVIAIAAAAGWGGYCLGHAHPEASNPIQLIDGSK